MQENQYQVDLIGQTLSWHVSYETTTHNKQHEGEPKKKMISESLEINMRTGEGLFSRPTRGTQFYTDITKYRNVAYTCRTQMPLVISLDF